MNNLPAPLYTSSRPDGVRYEVYPMVGGRFCVMKTGGRIPGLLIKAFASDFVQAKIAADVLVSGS